MRGHIRNRGSSWGLVVDLGRDPDSGKRRLKSKGGYRTRREAQRALADIIGQVNAGTWVDPPTSTVAEYLAEWLDGARVKPTSLAHYRALARAHVVPRIGHLPLQALAPEHLDRLYRDLERAGRRDGTGGLAPKTVRHVHTLVHKMLTDATRRGHLPRNVAALANPPTARPPEMSVWDIGQLRAFLHHTRGDRLFALWLLLATTGLRRGEALGLRWTDVDLGAAQLVVRRSLTMLGSQPHISEPKTPKSRRTLAIDPATVAALGAHRRRQAAERLAAGPHWVDTGLVFTRTNGAALNPQWVSTTFPKRAAAAGLPKIRLHSVRHSYATAALAAGVPAKVVSTRLGHANINITLDIYSHVLPSMDAAAAELVAASILT